uniref:Uncharacterized protein n=1 Tax=Arundo donax TaxID=35708 RepID=A0A0A9G1T4_ARUDO
MCCSHHNPLSSLWGMDNYFCICIISHKLGIR